MELDVLQLVATASEIDDLFGLPKGTTRGDLNDKNKNIRGRRSGGTWLVVISEAERFYRPTSDRQQNLIADLTASLEYVSVPHENVSVPNENVFVPNGNVSVPHENVFVPNGNVSVPNENVSVPSQVKIIEGGRRRTLHALNDDKPYCYKGKQMGELNWDSVRQMGTGEWLSKTEGGREKVCSHCSEKFLKKYQ